MSSFYHIVMHQRQENKSVDLNYLPQHVKPRNLIPTPQNSSKIKCFAKRGSPIFCKAF